MSRIDDLAAQYSAHIGVTWQQGLPAANRVVMLVYEKELDRQLRAKLLEFEQATTSAGHGWQLVDLTTAFADWMAASTSPSSSGCMDGGGASSASVP